MGTRGDKSEKPVAGAANKAAPDAGKKTPPPAVAKTPAVPVQSASGSPPAEVGKEPADKLQTAASKTAPVKSVVPAPKVAAPLLKPGTATPTTAVPKGAEAAKATTVPPQKPLDTKPVVAAPVAKPAAVTAPFSCVTPGSQSFSPAPVMVCGVPVQQAPRAVETVPPAGNPTPNAVPGWHRELSAAGPGAGPNVATAKPAVAVPAVSPEPIEPAVVKPVPSASSLPAASATPPVGLVPEARKAAVTPAPIAVPVNVPAPIPIVAPAAAVVDPPAALPASPPPSVAVVLEPPLLFEIAWEVCWQLGGIYTVLRSKAQAMIDRWGDRYVLIGPYNPKTAAMEFEEQPAYGAIREAMNRLRDQGVNCYFGRWLIPGRPRVILIDYRGRFSRLHLDKFLMWEDHRISLPADDGEVNEVVAFGFAVTELLRNIAELSKGRPIIAHFHEWMGGVAVPRLAHLRVPISTVFTTHATLLGRYLAGDNPYFYDHLPFLDAEKEAGKYNIYPRFAIERAAAHASTVFTTVSDVTAFEAEKLLGRTADVIVPNGINLHKFAAPHEFQHLHAGFKEKIHEFVMGHFFPSYTFDLDRTLYIFTSGRYEFRNKGMDLFIEAMHRLNWRLKGIQNPPTIVAFVITRAQTRNINVQVLQNQSMFEDLRNTCKDIQSQMGARLMQCTARGQLPGFNDLLREDDQIRLKRTMHAWKTHRQPLIITHDLADDATDPVLGHLRHRQMFNSADDPVKMIFHPEFLSATHPVMSLDYEQFVRGCHMGIFPSYYEPWGYTPLECVALGVPTVTSDLSGFGSYVQKHVWSKERRDSDRQGIHVLHRRGKSFDEACDALVNHLFNFAQLTRRQRIEMRNRTERLGEQFDWSTLVKHYDEAHNLALERIGLPKQGNLEVRMV